MSATKNLDLLSSAARLGLFAQRMASSAYYTAGEMPIRAPGNPATAYTADETGHHALPGRCWPAMLLLGFEFFEYFVG